MKDNGVVVSINKDLAHVEVNCLEACRDCSARSLCVGQKQAKGLLAVKNPLNACPGDEVQIEVPDTNYSKALIQLFGTLLIVALIGMAAGYLLSFLLPLSYSLTSPIGLFLGLFLGAAGLYRYFRKKNEEQLYPVIKEIIKKGECHG